MFFRAGNKGRGPWALSREFAIPIRRVEEIIDRMLPACDARNQLFAYKRELRRLEDLSGECFVIAKRDKNPEISGDDTRSKAERARRFDQQHGEKRLSSDASSAQRIH